MKQTWGRARDGRWHFARASHVATMDTACGLEGLESTRFVSYEKAAPDLKRRPRCVACTLAAGG